MDQIHGELRDLLDGICHTESVCGTCKKKECLIGYSRYINKISTNVIPPHIGGASESRPVFDMRRGYDEDDVLRVIAKTLVYCKACKEEHTDDCFLAVIRNNMEMIMFGEEMEYEGNPLSYLVKANEREATRGRALSEIYNEEKQK